MDRIYYLGQCVRRLMVLALCARAAGAQELSCQHRVLPIALRDEQNLPIQNVSATELEAKVHGKPVKILSLARDPRPHRIVLIMDTSGSMGSISGESSPVALEIALARHLFAVNHQKSQIALLTFNNDITEMIDFAGGNSAVGDKLQQIAYDHNYLKTKGRTALRDAILQGLQLLDHPSSADALYVLSDGGDNASKRSAADVKQRLALTSVRLFAVLLHQESGQRNRAPEELSGPNELYDIARKSGGEVLSAAAWHGGQIALSADPEGKLKTQETLARLYETILQNSLLEIEIPFPIAKNEHWELKLSDVARRQWKSARITYPITLISCTSEISGTGRH